jgi:hypothetical protein
MRNIIVGVCFFALSTSGALARDGFYVGGGLMLSDLNVSSFEGLPLDYSADQLGYNIRGGYQFHDLGLLNYLAVEASWEDLGTFHDTPELSDQQIPIGVSLPSGTNIGVDIEGYTAAVLGVFPFARDQFIAFGKAGYYDFDTEFEVAGSSISGPGDDGLLLGLGFMIGTIPSFAMRAEYTWFDTDDATTWTLGLSGQWYFGGGSD